MPKAVCPECEEEVFVDADCEQGDILTCDECGCRLEVVGLDPVELDVYEDSSFDGDDDESDYEGGF